MTEQQDHDAQVRALENEIRQLRQTLLDQFAMRAPAVPDNYPWREHSDVVQDGPLKRIVKVRESALTRAARYRYDYADAMLAERQRRIACPTK